MPATSPADAVLFARIREKLMSVELRTRSTGHKIGWWVLVVIAGFSIVGYLASVGLAATDMEVAAFFALAGINIYALSVLLTAYRRGEPWAWSSGE